MNWESIRERILIEEVSPEELQGLQFVLNTCLFEERKKPLKRKRWDEQRLTELAVNEGSFHLEYRLTQIATDLNGTQIQENGGKFRKILCA